MNVFSLLLSLEGRCYLTEPIHIYLSRELFHVILYKMLNHSECFRLVYPGSKSIYKKRQTFVLFFWSLWDRSHADQAGFELCLLLPPLPKSWNWVLDWLSLQLILFCFWDKVFLFSPGCITAQGVCPASVSLSTAGITDVSPYTNNCKLLKGNSFSVLAIACTRPEVQSPKTEPPPN